MTVGEVSKNLPWVEKYRPSKLEELISHDDIIKTINQFMKENQLPHLLFYGPPGTGKTSTILACARQMYTPQQFNSMVLELNASDDRGIGIVRGQILSFASTRTIFKAGPKLIILDEADAMTNDAQNALRRMGGTQGAEVMAGQCIGLRPPVPLQLCDVAGNALQTNMLANYLYDSDIILFVYDLTNLESFDKLAIWIQRVKEIFEIETTKPLMALFGNKSDLEHQRAVRLSCVQKFASEHLLETFKGSARTGEMKYTENVRFCIICNYLGKIIPALQSRCTRFRFAPLQQSQIVPRLKEVAAAENVKLSEDGVKALLALSGGDMRKVLNTLQSTWLAYRDVTEDNVYTCVGHPLRSDITKIFNWLLTENDFAVCFQNIQDLKLAKGLALGDILTEVHTIIQRVKLPAEVLVSLLIKMSDAEARLASGCSERIELAALIAAFQIARDQVQIGDTETS
uniref:Activator 1 subunit 5 n=2 Tax=Noctuidae TaxID=7100 RepID=A0A2H1V515_SPOFR